ncbi:polysaccharide biosynthesis protein [bacterium]|nr:polysaccharide biosynthesis protein [bacterium]
MLNDYKDKILVITGGSGSFGQTMLRHFLKTNVKEIRIFSRDEEKHDRMRHQYHDNRIKYYIGDVRDANAVDDVTRGADLCFHAAALKEVPSCEFWPMEAVRTNVIGSDNVINACVRNGVSRLVVLSTDKAAYPINAMGETKALMEKLMIAKARNIGDTKTVMCGTRYGNVMASRGSVIPLFVKQCKENKPITITDPNMTRFLMSLDESVDLVLFAFQNARNGDRFVQKAPASTILDLARAIQKLFGANNEIKIIGARHGEKMHETLVGREDMAAAEDMGKFYRIPADTRDLNYDNKTSDNATVNRDDDYTSENTYRLSVDEIIEKLKTLDYIKQELANKEFVGVSSK